MSGGIRTEALNLLASNTCTGARRERQKMLSKFVRVSTHPSLRAKIGRIFEDLGVAHQTASRDADDGLKILSVLHKSWQRRQSYASRKPNSGYTFPALRDNPL